KSIRESLERFLKVHREDGILQEEFVTIRNERFVVPLIAGQRRKLDGVIHGTSSSGHTLFVEPLETIDLNNELVRLAEEEMREVHRILRELTERLRGYADSILSTLVTMGELELIFAKARFATEFDCVRPRFSPDIAHIREMIADVTPDALVLLDEIGSATDPEEGGALGVAVIDHFRASGAFTLASTHLVALKIYGANTAGVLNASMGFNEETLAPTYRLHVGLPGKSAGLDIAARLGMPEEIIRRARASMSDRECDISRFLSELHRQVEGAA